MAPGQQWIFAPFRLDVDNASLWRETMAISLTPKAFAVLQHLVAHAGQLVTKEELLETVWPATAVGDAVLKVGMREIRKALGDTVQASRFIATVHRRGYRFIAPVIRAAHPGETRGGGEGERGRGGEGERGSLDALSLSATALVGRDAALRQLHGCFAQALQGERQVVFITGEGGIGKTALVQAFLAHAALEQGVWVTYGQCVEHYGTAEAYMPVLEALGRLCREPGHEHLIDLIRQQAPTWLVQMPWLLRPADRELLQRELLGATRERMLREMTEMFEILTAERPLVLVLEDLHWSDYATLDLIVALAHQRGPARFLLLGTYRPVEVIVNEHPLRTVKQALSVHGDCREFPLELLRAEDIARYLALRFPQHQMPPALPQVIHQRTDGQPLFMVHIIDSWVAQGVLREQQGVWTLQGSVEHIEVGVPESIRQMLEQQFERLTLTEQHVLEAASAAGIEFSAATVAAALDADMMQVEACCEGLAQRWLFLQSAGIGEWPDGTMAERYGFRHALYQDVVYQRVATTRRLRFHRRIAAHGELTYGTRVHEIAAELAMHYERGRDYRQAVQYLQQVADQAVRRYANREALGALTRALELAQSLPEAPYADVAMTLLEQRGLVYRAIADTPRTVADFTMLATSARRQGRLDVEVNALFYVASALSWVDREQCLETVEHTVALSHQLTDPVLQAHTRGWAAYWHLLWRGWQDADAAACAAAVTATRQAGDRTLLGLHLGRYSYFQSLRSSYRSACQAAEEGLQLALEVGDASEYLTCQFFWAWALLHVGEWGQMLRVTRDGTQTAEKNGHFRWAMLLQLEQAWLAIQVGDYARAQVLAERSLQQAREAGLAYAHLLSALLMGLSHLGLRHPTEAFAYFAEMNHWLARERVLMDWILRMPLHYGLSTYWLEQGAYARARQEAEQLCSLAAGPGERTYLALGYQLLTAIALAGQQDAQAEAAISQALAALEGVEAPLAAWRVYATAAQWHARQRRHAEAAAYWGRSATVVQQLAETLGEAAELRQAFLNSPEVGTILHQAHSPAPSPAGRG